MRRLPQSALREAQAHPGEGQVCAHRGVPPHQIHDKGAARGTIICVVTSLVRGTHFARGDDAPQEAYLYYWRHTAIKYEERVSFDDGGVVPVVADEESETL